jgi:hypothetical protein
MQRARTAVMDDAARCDELISDREDGSDNIAALTRKSGDSEDEVVHVRTLCHDDNTMPHMTSPNAIRWDVP